MSEAPALILGCLTGSDRLRGSRTRENDLLVLRQRRHFRCELGHVDRASEMYLAALLLVFVRTDEECAAGHHLLPCLGHVDAFNGRHTFSPFHCPTVPTSSHADAGQAGR